MISASSGSAPIRSSTAPIVAASSSTGMSTETRRRSLIWHWYNAHVSVRLAWAVPALLFLALAVRLVAVVATPHYVPRHDDRDYDRLACWVSDHGVPPDRGPPFP